MPGPAKRKNSIVQPRKSRRPRQGLFVCTVALSCACGRFIADAPQVDGDAQPGDGGATIVDAAAAADAADAADAMAARSRGRISAGGGHSCAIVNGAAYCWGRNGSGQVGLSPDAATIVATPTKVEGLPTVVAIAAGSDHTCAIDVDQRLWCWGVNGNGQTGNGTASASALPPQQALAPSGVAGYLQGVDSVVCGRSTFVLVGDRAFSTGDLSRYGLGRGSVEDNRFAPIQADAGTTFVAARDYEGCAVVDGSVLTWGQNSSDQIVPGGEDGGLFLPVQLVHDAGRAIECGIGAHGCGLVDDGAVFCWGDPRGSGAPTGVVAPHIVGGLASITSIHVGKGAFTCALAANGDVWCLGEQLYGHLGNGLTSAGVATTPQIVQGLTAVEISAGYEHTCALRTDGRVVCWGSNASGQLGPQASGGASGTPVVVPLP
jgi:alpha-tubulin suppressor-like RCC1 family protein